MLSYGSAFWPLFWGILGGGVALTIAAVVLYATATQRAAARAAAVRRAIVHVPAPRRPTSMAPSAR